MAILHRFLGFLGVIKKKAEEEAVQGLAKRLAIKMRSIEAPVSSLSGGNQQKVVLSKWFGAGCRVILFDEPTRGVDVGAKAEIYRLIDELAGDGLAVVLISSDLVEVIGMSDRILVMSRGRIAGELPKAELVLSLSRGNFRSSEKRALVPGVSVAQKYQSPIISSTRNSPRRKSAHPRGRRSLLLLSRAEHERSRLGTTVVLPREQIVLAKEHQLLASNARRRRYSARHASRRNHRRRYAISFRWSAR